MAVFSRRLAGCVSGLGRGMCRGLSPVAAVAREAAEVAWQADVAGAYCPRCGATIAAEAVDEAGCPFCRGKQLPWKSLIRLGAYQPPLSGWIVQMKFHRRWPWAPWFGGELARRMVESGESRGCATSVLCPLPMHWLRRWSRGFNQSQMIAEAVARQGGWRLTPLLHRIRYTPAQTAIAPSRRHHNVRDSVAGLPIDLAGWRVWIIDDVKTSGATLETAARELRRMGARDIHVAVVAVADPRGGNFRQIAAKPGFAGE
ncbi:MAG: ComF family protein [Phycisphaeraceae bacterium]|nr:ComF family protein [Phycisphaeraceae bacterium]